MGESLDTRHKAPMLAIRGTADEADDRGLSWSDPRSDRQLAPLNILQSDDFTSDCN